MLYLKTDFMSDPKIGMNIKLVLVNNQIRLVTEM